MKNIFKAIAYLSIIFTTMLSEAHSRYIASPHVIRVRYGIVYKGTEYQPILDKRYVDSARLDEIVTKPCFKGFYNVYTNLLKTGETFPEIENNLKNHFILKMRDAVVDLQNWEKLIKNRIILKNVNRDDIVDGALWITLSAALAKFGHFMLTSGVHKDFEPMGFSFMTTMVLLGVPFYVNKGIETLKNSRNYSQRLQADIDMLDANYAHAFPGEEKLSIQVARELAQEAA